MYTRLQCVYAIDIRCNVNFFLQAMTYIHNKDIAYAVLSLRDVKETINEILKDSKYWDDLSEEDRCKLVYKFRTRMIRGENLEYMATYYSFKRSETETYEIFTGSIGKKAVLTHAKSGIDVFQSNDPAEAIALNLDLNQVDAFKNMKAQWLYFKLQAVEVEFRNNSKASFIPILCHYLPPCYEYVEHATSFTNNTVVASGTKEEKKTIADPFYVVRFADSGVKLDPSSPDYIDVVRKSTYPVSGLQKNMYVANFNTEKIFLDYGKFVFTTKNLDNIQDIIVRVKFDFVFLTYANPEDYYNQFGDAD